MLVGTLLVVVVGAVVVLGSTFEGGALFFFVYSSSFAWWFFLVTMICKEFLLLLSELPSLWDIQPPISHNVLANLYSRCWHWLMVMTWRVVFPFLLVVWGKRTETSNAYMCVHMLSFPHLFARRKKY